MRNMLLLLLGILLLPLSVLAGGAPPSIEDVQLIQTEEAATQLSAYYDLRDRKSYIQVTNVTSSTVGIHIQILWSF